jgi:hypothetical protein
MFSRVTSKANSFISLEQLTSFLLRVVTSVFWGVQIFPFFYLKLLHDFYTYKMFFVKEIALIRQISRKNSKSLDFYKKFQQVAKI